MSVRAWLWLACVTWIGSAAACGDDDGGNGPTVNRDAGSDSGMDAAAPDAGSPEPDSAVPDAASMDAAADAGEDAGLDAGDATTPDAIVETPLTVPDDWTCLGTLWNDNWCDCGCSTHDIDCAGEDCTTPGCLPVSSTCQACFTAEGSWKSCAPDPDPDGWTFCDESLRSGDDHTSVICDCGCGAPDPDCLGQGCFEPGCRKPGCEVRHGCEQDGIDPSDTCGNNPPSGWGCPWGSYGSGDGCDCGCGIVDPDCAGSGCSESRCYANSCDRCNDGDGRPYSCAAAQGGWAHDSACDAAGFDADDGCDCGCGGIDPDCGNDEGCGEPGCSDDGCDRCTDGLDGRPVGCSVPSQWTAVCPIDNYGTGDGCDCGCGAPDPDCDGEGSIDPEQPFAAACDICHDSTAVDDEGFVPCPGWTCGPVLSGPTRYFDAACDCGCGVIDPYCRDVHQASCQGPGCTQASCEYCNDDPGGRTECGPTWGAGGITCNIEFYDVDGLCDCGCGADDPDCGDLGCHDQGCIAPGCDVCHNGTTVESCDVWHCDASAFDAADGVCDCGCGANDPDCAGGGCKDPGCNELWMDGDPVEQECDACHDPYGRLVECP